MTQPTQQELFNQETATIASKEFKASTYLWNYFFEEYGLMLLDEQLKGIVMAVETYKNKLNEVG